MNIIWLYRLYTTAAVFGVAISVFNFARARVLWKATRSKAAVFCQGVATLTFLTSTMSTFYCSELGFALPPLGMSTVSVLEGVLLLATCAIALLQLLLLTVSPRWLGR